MKILIACEESQRICIEFRAKRHTAYSCDVLECSGGHPEWHIQQDVLPLINGDCEFKTMDGKGHCIKGQWDLLIAHPPCTYLTVSGNRWFNKKYGEKAIEREIKRKEAINFFMKFVNAECKKIAIENPVGCMSRIYEKPQQIIEPFHFGDYARKRTCLWLKNLSPLKPTKLVNPGILVVSGNKTYSSGASADYARDEGGKILKWNDPKTAKIRSKTFPGIAKAMAEQWG